MSELEDKTKFKRFIYFTNEQLQHIVKKNYVENSKLVIKSVINLVANENYKHLITVIEEASNDESLPNRSFLFFILMHLARNYESKELRTAIYDIVPKIIKSPKEFFLFLKYDKDFHKNIASGFKRVIRNYYLKTDISHLYNLVTLQNKYNGWSHKDVITVAHLKSENLAQEILLTYACKGLEAAKGKVSDNKQMTPEIEDILKKLEELQKFKHCQDEKQAANMVKENKYVLSQIPSKFLKSQIVWEALIPQMQIPDVIKELNRFHRLGFFKANSPILAKVVDVISDNEKCKKCKITPAEVLIEMRTLERGKPIDPKFKAYLATQQLTEILTQKVDAETQTTTIVNSKEKLESTGFKNNIILNAFTKLLNSAFRNPFPTGKRFMITIDLRQPQMLKPTFGTKTVNCLEAATVISLALMKVEKDVTVGVFNGDSVNIVQFAKGQTFNQVFQKLKESPSSYVLLSKPFYWATEKNKHIDVFINIMYTGDAVTRIPKDVKEKLFKDGKKDELNVMSAWKKYKSKMKLAHTKLINISLAGKSLCIAGGAKGTLDINGFNAAVPKMIAAFSKGTVL